MKDIFTVFFFTLRDNVRKKAFIISTIIVLLFIVIACLIPIMIGGSKSNDTTPDNSANVEHTTQVNKSSTCYLFDESGSIPGAQEALSEAFPQVGFVIGESGKLDECISAIETDKKLSAIQINPGKPVPSLRFYATDFMSGLPTDSIKELLRKIYIASYLEKTGVSEDVTQLALTDLNYETISVGKMDISGYALGIVLTMIIFFSIYFYGYGVAMSVASEKTSRVMETLIVSAKPSRILLGKCLAMGVLGLIQLSLFLIVGAISFTTLVPEDFTIAGMPLALSSFTVSSALLILLYFLLGYSLYAMINSVCGATVSRAEDLNSAMMPSVFISLISFYAAYVVMFIPDSGIKRIVTYVPFTSPFIMPFRLLNETVAISDILISTVLLIVAIALVSVVSIHLYSASVLHYGQRLKLKDLFKLQK